DRDGELLRELLQLEHTCGWTGPRTTGIRFNEQHCGAIRHIENLVQVSCGNGRERPGKASVGSGREAAGKRRFRRLSVTAGHELVDIRNTAEGGDTVRKHLTLKIRFATRDGRIEVNGIIAAESGGGDTRDLSHGSPARRYARIEFEQ